MVISNYQSPYTPNTDDDRRQMLEAIGVDSVEELFNDIPEGYSVESLNLPSARSEPELMAYAQQLAATNIVPGEYASFLGAGLPSPHSGCRQANYEPQRVHDGLYALPARSFPGHFADCIRVPDVDLPIDRHGGRKPGHVRRFDVDG